LGRSGLGATPGRDFEFDVDENTEPENDATEGDQLREAPTEKLQFEKIPARAENAKRCRISVRRVGFRRHFFASGYGEQASVPMEHRARAVVQKPYTATNIVRAIDNLIGKPEA